MVCVGLVLVMLISENRRKILKGTSKDCDKLKPRKILQIPLAFADKYEKWTIND